MTAHHPLHRQIARAGVKNDRPMIEERRRGERFGVGPPAGGEFLQVRDQLFADFALITCLFMASLRPPAAA